MSKTVLVADDDQFQLMSMTSILKACNVNVISCVDGQDAINKYTEKYKDVSIILLDIHMPKKDGFQACEEILNLQKKFGQNQKIYGCSADDDDDTLEKAIDSGMTSLLTKPISKASINQLF